MMKTSFIIFFIVLNSLGLKAQHPKWPSPEHNAKGRVNMLKSILNLTNQQTEKVMQIYLNHYNYRDSITRIIVKRGPNPEVINSKLTPVFHAKELETNKMVSSVLDDKQKVAYAKFNSSRKPEYIMSVKSVSPK
jgi:hypothetical protein